MNTNHRPSESNDLSLSYGMGSLVNIDKTMEGMNNEGSSKDKKVLIKVNTKRHQLNGNLSQINTNRTKRVINLKENGLFQNLNQINNINHKSPKNKKIEYDNDMKKITLIQNWWKNIYDKNKKKLNSISFLVACVHKIFCSKTFDLINNKFPSIDYFFHKWNDKVTKLKIINHLLKKVKKTRNKKDKNDINNKLVKKSTNKNNQEKSKDKNQKSKLLKGKKKTNLILNNINIETTKMKECQTTKHNKKRNLINFTLNTNACYNNKKKPTPNSPIMISTTERHISPISILNKNICIRKPQKSNILEKNISNTNKDNIKNKERKSNKLNDINNEKNTKKKPEEKMHKLKVIKNTDNNKKVNSNTTSSKNENHFTLIENPRNLQSSRINNYILNIDKKDMNISQMYCNYNKKSKKENKLNNNSNKNSNNKSLHFNTEVNSNKINSIFKMNKQNTKVYENCLYKDNKYQNYYSPINKELYSKINNKDNLVLFNKNVILINKEKGKLSSVKELNNLKKNKFSYNTISETNSTLSKISSIDNTSHRKMKKGKHKNINIFKYFFYWKEYVNKKNIIKKLYINSKFIFCINHCTNNILLRKSLEKLMRIYRKEKLYVFFKNIIIKLIINIMKKVAEFKSNYINDTKNKCHNKYFYYKKGSGDIINNININNFINYGDYKLFHKRKARSPKVIPKAKKSRTINNNSELNYYGTKLSLSNSSSNKIIDINKQKKPISINAFDYNDNDNIIEKDNNYGNITNYNDKYNKYMNGRFINYNYKKIDNKIQKIEEGVIVDQINQLKMVFNLLERHNSKNNKSIKKISLSNCFDKWKLLSFNKNLYPHKINEKIINLKPFQNSKIIKSTIGNPIDISLKKKCKENKSSPKIINVINVQNYNENNNYNYNFKCLPIKGTPIYALNQRNSYDCYNIDKLNSDFTNLTYNDNNVISPNVNNNFNLNTTSFFILNDNKSTNQNIVYHKKRLDKTYINHNSNNFLVNDCNLNNFYKYNKGNYASSLYFIGHNKSQIILPDFDSKIYNLKKNTKVSPTQSRSIYRDNSYNNIPSCIYQDPFPELKYGFEKKNHIEEKEINFFENTNNTNSNNNQNIYIKKQSGESKKSKFNINNNKFIKTSVFNIDENENKKDKNNNNLIKTLNIQFGNSNRQLEYSDNCLYNDNNKFITINKDKNQDIIRNSDKYSKSSLGIKNYKNIFDDKKIKNRHKYRTTNIIKNLSKMAYYNTNSVAEFDYKDPMQKRINQTFIFYPKLIEDFEDPNLKANFNSI